MKVDFIYPKHYDLIFHVLSYFNVNNASNLYDEKYIEKMEEEKKKHLYNFKPLINSLQAYYNANFERLMLINFLPFYCNSYEEMKNNFLTCNRFTQDDLKCFIEPFIEMLDKESVFFFDYWEVQKDKYEATRQATEEYFKNELRKYSFVFEHFNKPCKVLFSFAITKNGRGFYSDSHFAALVRFPEDKYTFDFSFIQLLHEYTHSFTDNLLNKNINMQDGSHSLSENVVILADYYLIKSIDEKFVPKYFEWLGYNQNEDFDESKFLSIFHIEESLKMELMKLINDILHTRT